MGLPPLSCTGTANRFPSVLTAGKAQHGERGVGGGNQFGSAGSAECAKGELPRGTGTAAPHRAASAAQSRPGGCLGGGVAPTAPSACQQHPPPTRFCSCEVRAALCWAPPCWVRPAVGSVRVPTGKPQRGEPGKMRCRSLLPACSLPLAPDPSQDPPAGWGATQREGRSSASFAPVRSTTAAGRRGVRWDGAVGRRWLPDPEWCWDPDPPPSTPLAVLAARGPAGWHQRLSALSAGQGTTPAAPPQQ